MPFNSGRLYDVLPSNSRRRGMHWQSDHLCVRTFTMVQQSILRNLISCRQLEAVEALGWTALGLCVLTLLVALFSWHSRRSYVRRSPSRVNEMYSHLNQRHGSYRV